MADAGELQRYLLCQNEYFVTERVEMAAGAVYNGRCDGSSLEIWGVINGSATIGSEASADVSLSAVELVLYHWLNLVRICSGIVSFHTVVSHHGHQLELACTKSL